MRVSTEIFKRGWMKLYHESQASAESGESLLVFPVLDLFSIAENGGDFLPDPVLVFEVSREHGDGV